MAERERPKLTPPRGHDEVLEGLWRSARDGRLPHALCLEGPEGIGKFRVALWLAVGLLCERGPGRPCLECGPCKRAVSWNHFDLFVVDVVELGFEKLRLGRLVERPPERVHRDDRDAVPVERFLGYVAAEGGWRIVVVREADRATEEAQNSILKLLEEPGEGTLWLLETARPEALLPTVRSRLVSAPLRPLAPETVSQVLLEHGVEAERGARLARWSKGSVGGSLALLRQGAEEVLPRLAAVLAGNRRPLAAAAEVFALKGEFAGRTELARDRARARAALDLALGLARDQARSDLGLDPDRLALGEFVLPGAGQRARRVLASGVVRELVDARAAVDGNVSPGPVLGQALTVLARLAPAAGPARGTAGRSARMGTPA